MVPRFPRRAFGLISRILNWNSIDTVHALLFHRNSVEVSLATLARSNSFSQLFTSIVHAGVHAMSLLFDHFALLATEDLPRAVDGPMTEVAETSHSERRRSGREHVLFEGLDALVVFRLGGRSVLAGGFGCRGGLTRHGGRCG